ncbi:hypothetical protein DFJ74DRAFT_697270, partial [Hyaloraphidium curvatum]
MRRPLNEIEYMNFCIPQPYNMVLCARLRGAVGAAEVRDALDTAQRRHPLLRANVSHDEHGYPCFDSEGIGEIPLRVASRVPNDEGAADRVADDELGAVFPLHPPHPLLRATLLLPEPPDATADLVLCAQHYIADGRSMLLLLRDLLASMADPARDPGTEDASASAEDLLPPSVRRWMPTSTLRLHAMRWLLAPFAWFNPSPPPAAAGHAVHRRSWSLSPERTVKLIARCKAEGVSVQSALCTAFSPSYRTINTPVDLRTLLARDVGQSVGLYVGSAIVTHAYDPRLGFWANARAYHPLLRKAMANPFLPFMAITPRAPPELVQKAGDAAVAAFARGRPFAVTNLGSAERQGIDLRSGPVKVDAVSGGVTPILGAASVLVYTLGGEMRFHLAAPTELREEEVAGEAERAMRMLESALEE